MKNIRFYTILIIGLLLSTSSLFAQSDKQKKLEASTSADFKRNEAN